MLFRTKNNKLIEVKRESFTNDAEYYTYIYLLKFNKKSHKKNDSCENIISSILYEDK